MYSWCCDNLIGLFLYINIHHIESNVNYLLLNKKQIVGQGPIKLAVCVGGGSLDIFPLVYLFSFLSPSLADGLI